MYLIEGHWESIDEVSDVVKVVREYYNRELADILQELAIDYYKYERERLEDMIDDLEWQLDELESENDDLENEVYRLNQEVEELEEKIREFETE